MPPHMRENASVQTVRDHPGNTPGQGPVNILDHPTWAWVELARIRPMEADNDALLSRDEGRGFANSELRDHDLPGAIIYSSFVGEPPDVWPVLPKKTATLWWVAVGALSGFALVGVTAWWAAGSVTPPAFRFEALT